MDLQDAAVFFDTTSVYDAYTGAFLWKCQYSSFNDANVVGSTSTRRILSIGPGLSLPARRAVRILESVWLVGDGNTDAWDEDDIRQSFNMKKAMTSTRYGPPGLAAQGLLTQVSYTQREFFREQIDLLNSTNSSTIWNSYCAPAESVVSGTILYDGSLYLRVYMVHLPLEGLLVSECQELSGLVTATFEGSTYNPLTDTLTGSPVAVPALWVPSTRLYREADATSPKPGPGDITLLVPSSQVTPKVGGKVTLPAGKFRIVACLAELDAWLVQVRDA